jgi:hypothetical protein
MPNENERHPGDQPGTTIEDLEILAVGASRDGRALTADDLDAVASASTQVGFSPPLRLAAGENVGLAPEAAPAFGWLSDIRREGQRLLATASGVPRKLARLITQGAYRKIGTDLYFHYKSSRGQWPLVLKGVTLHGDGLPRVNSLADLESLYSHGHRSRDGAGQEVRTYAGRLITAGDVDDLIYDEHSEGAVCAKEDPAMSGSILTPAELLHWRAVGVRRARPEWSYEDAVAYCLQLDPELKRALAANPTAIPPSVAVVAVRGESAAERRKAAGDEVLAKAKTWLAEHADQGVTLEDGNRAVLARDPDLTRRYAGFA